MEKVVELFQKIPKSYYLPILLLVSGTIFFGIGLMQLLGSHPKSDVLPLSTQDTTATTSSHTSFGLIKVDVEGAVIHPGVYSLPTASRVEDAVIAAGGVSATADRTVVQQRINLAAKLTDGMKIYIPDVGGQGGAVQNQSTEYVGGQVRLIDLNSATADELDSLPGVGQTTAQKIIAARPFASVSELLSKKVVSSTVYEKVKTLVTTY